ncbi:MAG: sulfotransferase [Alphaproteobacteria bacterium]|nr:sulfotransferase [Alphaproteobacteria bacterium]
MADTAAGHRRSPIHLLVGAPLPQLLRSIRRHGGVSPRYLLQAAALFAIALVRLPEIAIEAAMMRKRIASAQRDLAPVIIVGHWRSGTTYLHNLLARDPFFRTPRMFESALPYEFAPGPITTFRRWLLRWLLPATRPMDDVPLADDVAQEDEIALAAMGAPSFFNCFYFPSRLQETFAREVLFEGLSAKEHALFAGRLRYFLAKLRAVEPCGRLLLKNPAHSARIPALREMLPRARFIHIRRNPAEVFVSTRRLYRSMLPWLALQDFETVDIEDHVLWAYPRIMDPLLAGLAAFAPGEVIEVRYEDLIAAPGDTLAMIYTALGMERPAPPIAESAAMPSRTTVTASDIAKVNGRWASYFERLGYARPCVET